MKRPYFQKKTGVNQDILNIDDIRNIGFSDNKLWWGEAVGGNPRATLYVRSAESITSATVAEDSAQTNNDSTWTVINTLLRTSGVYIFCAADFSGFGHELVFLRSVNSGLTFNTFSIVANELFVYDMFRQSGQDVVMIHVDNEVQFHDISVGWQEYGDLSLTNENWVYPGVLVDGIYYFMIYDGSNYKKYSFVIGSGIVLLETFTDITTPFSFDFKRQQYYLVGNTEILIDNTHFWWRDPVNHIWQSFSVPVATDTIAMIWAHNHLNEHIIPFSIWDRYIIEITDKGVLKKIQAIEPRDYKKVYLTNINENLAGVVQFQDRNGNDDLSAFTLSTPTDTSITVIGLKNGRKNRLRLLDESGANLLTVLLPISNTATTGFYEFHVMSEDLGINSTRMDFILYDGSTSHMLEFEIFDGNFTYYDGSRHTIVAITYNVEYNIKITFDTGGTWSVEINGISYGPFGYVGTPSIFDNFYIRTNNGRTADIYFDSLGFSWDGFVSGSTKKINAFIGYGSEIGEAWFSTGDPETSIMQLSFKDYTSGTVKSLTVLEIYKAPEHTLIRRTKPFNDEWVKEYTDAGKLFYGGKVKDNDSDNRLMYIYLMKSWQDENEETKVIANLSQYTHKELLEYVLDNFSRYRKYGPGTNADVLEFDQGLTGWVITGDDANETATYLSKKAFVNGFMYNVLELWDNDAASNLLADNTNFSGTVVSFWIATSDVTKTNYWYLYEGGTVIVTFYILSSKIQINGGGIQILLDPAVNDIKYHFALNFNVSDDTVDVYINGVFNSTQNLQNNITTEITRILIGTNTGHSGYYHYTSQVYVGNSLIDAMHTFSSISPLLTTKHDFNLIDYSIPNVYKLIVEETGYIVSERPDGMVYVDQYAPSGKTINMNEEQGITFMGRLKERNEKFSFITFYGGFVNGKPIFSQGFGEPNFGSYEDWFPTIDGRDPDDIYYDADGNPKSHRLDAMVATALINRNIVVKKVTMGKRGVGMFIPGTSLTYNNNHYKISMETWYAWRRNKYNGITNDNRVEIADSLLSPTKGDPEDTKEEQIDAAISENAEDIVKVEQSVGYLAERVRSRDVLAIYLEENVRNFNENLWGFYNTIALTQTLNSGSPINATVGCHRILFIVNTGGDVSGTITITGTTRDRTDTSQSTPADTEDIIIDSLSTDNSSSDTEGNVIHEFDNVFISDKWFEGSIVISTTDLTITDVDVIAILYHQFDSFKLITLKTFDFTGKVTNASGWFYAYLYVITHVNSDKKYNIEKLVAHEIPSALTVANEGYRRRKIIDVLIDGNAGDGIWAELFFGPAAAMYWQDISIYLTALLDDGTD